MRLRSRRRRSRSISAAARSAMRGSRSAASRPSRGARARRSACSSAARRMPRRSARPLPQEGRAGVSPPAGRELSLLQTREVRYNGEPIALVVAESFEQATYAASLVRAAYRVAPAAIDMERALPSAEPYTQKILGLFEPASRRGHVRDALKRCDATIDNRYTTPL